MNSIHSYAEFSDLIQRDQMVLLYTTTPGCSVCHALKPQVEELLHQYPAVTAVHADTSDVPELAGQLTIFSAPAVIFFLNGKETFRMARFVPMEELKENIDKMHKII